MLAREAVVRFTQDSIASAVGRQKRNADKNGSAYVLSFTVHYLVLLATVNLPRHAVANVSSSILLTKYIGSFRVLHCQENAYKIELTRRMSTLSSFYFRRLRPYHPYKDVHDNG